MVRSHIYESIFNMYVEEGREISMKELKVLTRGMPFPKSSLRIIVRRIRKLYSDRWHEIYATKTGVVHTKAPVAAKEDLPDTTHTKVDPLEALKKARAKKEEEHE